MNSLNLEFSQDDIETLSALIGDRWRFLGSREMNDDGTTSWFEVFFATDHHERSLKIRMNDVDFSDHEDEISSFVVERGLIGEPKARSAGLIFFHFKNEVIRSIRIIRESISYSIDGRETLDLSVDEGVIFDFETGSLTVIRANEYSDEITVLRTPSGAEPELPEVGCILDSDLRCRFDAHRSIVPILHRE